MSEWKTGSPRHLLQDLKPGGFVQGLSGLFERALRLHKTDVMTDLRQMSMGKTLTWRVVNPDNTGAHARPRRSVIIWLGK